MNFKSKLILVAASNFGLMLLFFIISRANNWDIETKALVDIDIKNTNDFEMLVTFVIMTFFVFCLNLFLFSMKQTSFYSSDVNKILSCISYKKPNPALHPNPLRGSGELFVRRRST